MVGGGFSLATFVCAHCKTRAFPTERGAASAADEQAHRLNEMAPDVASFFPNMLSLQILKFETLGFVDFENLVTTSAANHHEFLLVEC